MIGELLLAGGFVLITFVVNSLVLRMVLAAVSGRDNSNRTPVLRDAGFWIGFCEHGLITVFVLVGEFTAIGLIFAAKELARPAEIRASKDYASYYLLGTLLNVLLSLIAALALKHGLELGVVAQLD